MKESKPTLADLRRLREAPAQAAAQAQAAAKQAAAKQAAAARRAKVHQHLMAAAHQSPATQRPAAVPPESPSPAFALDAADCALFRQAMRFVQPLPDRGPRARVLSARDPDAILQTRRQHAQGDATQPWSQTPALPKQRPQAFDPEATEFLQAGCGTDLLRGLHRGKWTPQATLDLHGSSLEQAYERLDQFLGSCLAHNIRCVCIVHGKGFGSHKGKSILKTPIRQHLCRLEAIQAWVECNERNGGAGAVIALLRMPDPNQSPP
ncbi:Smr/MutS family protein [Castellaniella sp.]|uniref:Smr/MutS family protein n=1 Tax=Castellaniella sp. TaxID=1955812 RepID=UPI002AFFD7D0|nr:Smr/MutS family protein [Castellaniella sp.]